MRMSVYTRLMQNTKLSTKLQVCIVVPRTLSSLLDHLISPPPSSSVLPRFSVFNEKSFALDPSTAEDLRIVPVAFFHLETATIEEIWSQFPRSSSCYPACGRRNAQKQSHCVLHHRRCCFFQQPFGGQRTFGLPWGINCWGRKNRASPAGLNS